MGRFRITQGLLGIFILTVAGLALGNSGGPIAGVTGAPSINGLPAEGSCQNAGCHVGNPANAGGTVEVLGVPAVYEPGASYPLVVRLTSSQTQASFTRRWGFEITAILLDTGRGGGTFDPGNLRTVSGSGGRTYVTHDAATLQSGASSPVTWSFNWTAPDADVGPVGFYVAGNAANGNLLNTGDWIYTGADTAGAPMTPVLPVTWGRLKRLYPERRVSP